MFKIVKFTKYIYIAVALIALYFLSEIFGKDSDKPIGSYTPASDSLYNPLDFQNPYGWYVDQTIKLFNAIDGLGTDVGSIEDVFDVITPLELQLINQIYGQSYDESLATALRADLGLFNGDLLSRLKGAFAQSGIPF